MSGPSIGVGILGSGQISRRYLTTLMAAPSVDVVSCADISQERAAERAEQFGVPKAYGPDELFADPDVQIVVNLTWHKVHQEMSLAAIAAGKSVYSEKPLAATFEGAQLIVDAARSANVRVGVAPATFLGAGLQTSRAQIDAGAIGTPFAASAFFLDPGVDADVWDPAAYYSAGGGPLFDGGPYYLSALVNLLGPARRVSGSAPRTASERHLTVGRRAGETIPVEVPTHASATIDFSSGAVGTLMASWGVIATVADGFIEIYGTEGTLHIPDPNDLGGPITVCRAGEDEWRAVDLRAVPWDSDEWWGIGVVDMALGLLNDRPHRATPELGLHVTEIMQGVYDASDSGQAAKLTTTVERPPLLPDPWDGIQEGTADE
jgi:predicted dehydrogenase